jgi:hypothetical protein
MLYIMNKGTQSQHDPVIGILWNAREMIVNGCNDDTMRRVVSHIDLAEHLMTFLPTRPCDDDVVQYMAQHIPFLNEVSRIVDCTLPREEDVRMALVVRKSIAKLAASASISALLTCFKSVMLREQPQQRTSETQETHHTPEELLRQRMGEIQALFRAGQQKVTDVTGIPEGGAE